MLLRAIFAVLALPGIFAGLIPLLIVQSDKGRGSGYSIGGALMVIGIGILLSCVRDFLVIGKGTLAPWDAPKRLVVVGLYRFVRNPMYVGIITLLIGWCLWSGSKWLWVYLVVLTVAFHLRIVLYEEPRLAREFPEDWILYRERVNRWILWLGGRR